MLVWYAMLKQNRDPLRESYHSAASRTGANGMTSRKETDMTEPIVVTLCAVAFLTLLFRTGDTFRRRNVDMDGEPPIDRTVFYLSKYSILLVWLAMALHSSGLVIPVEMTRALKWPSRFSGFRGLRCSLGGDSGLAARSESDLPTRRHVSRQMGCSR